MAANFKISFKAFSLPLVVILTLSGHVYSQDQTLFEDWRWVRFTTENGLPSNRILDVVETSDGISWAVTSAGLAWYDGFTWNVVRDSMLTNGVGSVFANTYGMSLIASNGNLYIGNEQGFHSQVITLNGKRLLLEQAFPLGGNNYFVVADNSVYVYSSVENILRPIPIPSPFGNKPSCYFTKAGGIWINVKTGLYRWDGKTWIQELKALRDEYKIKILNGNESKSVFASIISPLESKGTWEFQQGKPAVHDFSGGQEVIKAMDTSPEDETMVIYESGNIRIHLGSTWLPLNTIPSQLRNVLFIKYRKNGDLWVGTESGLFLHKHSSHRWTYWKHSFPSRKNYVHEIIRTKDHLIWLATSFGIEVRTEDGRIVKTVDRIDGKDLNVITGLCEDDSGRVWISSGSQFRGAYRWDGKRWKHFGIAEGLDAVNFHKINKDREGRLWFLGLGAGIAGDSSQPGAFVYANDRFTHWGTKEGLINGRVYAFAQTRDSALWFGTMRGISRWKNGGWTYWTDKRGIQSIKVFAFVVDSSDRVWFSEYYKGLGYIDNNDSVRHFTTANGLAGDLVWDLKFDAEGALWLSTRDGEGISKFSHGTWSTFNLSAGLSNLTLWPLLTLNDRLYVGTDGDGVNILSFEESTNPRPRVGIQEPVIETNNVLVRWSASTYWEEVPMREVKTRFRLDDQSWSGWSTQRELTMSGISVGNHTFQVQAKSLFGNFDSLGQRMEFAVAPAWYFRTTFALPVIALIMTIVYLGFTSLARKRKHAIALKASEAKFRRLTEATFEGIAIHNEGVIIDANQSVLTMFGYEQHEFLGKSLLECVAPASRDSAAEYLRSDNERPYEVAGVTRNGSTIFVEIIGKSIPYENNIVRVAAIRDVTERKLAEQKLIAYQERLKALTSELALTEDRERRHMATYLHDSISQALAFCKIKLRSLKDTPMPHEVANTLHEVTTLIDRLIENAQTLTFELSPPILQELGFKETVEWLADQIHEQHKIVVSVADDGAMKPLSEDIRGVLFQCVREALINIAKHSCSKDAIVCIQKVNNFIHVEIEDHGIGFEPHSINLHARSGGGFGLFNMHERLSHLGGHVAIESQPNKGTRIILTSPLTSKLT